MLPSRIDSSDKLKKELLSLEKTLYSKGSTDEAFSSFYTFLFPFLKADGAKIVQADVAVAVLEIVLAPKYELGKAFVEYAQVRRNCPSSPFLSVRCSPFAYSPGSGRQVQGYVD